MNGYSPLTGVSEKNKFYLVPYRLYARPLVVLSNFIELHYTTAGNIPKRPVLSENVWLAFPQIEQRLCEKGGHPCDLD
jgi:hypothetical protein